MFIVGIFSWWYSKGFIRRIQMIKSRLIVSADFFSIRLLVATLFAPYKQISADVAGVSLADKIRAFFDKLFSRCVGAVVRTFMIIFGIIAMFLQVLLGVGILIFWLIMPILPVVGLIVMSIGWLPQ